MGCAHSFVKTRKELLEVYSKAAKTNDANWQAENDPCLQSAAFDNKQASVLKETWKTISLNKESKGIAVLTHIFKEFPDAKKLFPFKDLEGEDLRNSHFLRAHALRFMNAVDATVQSVEALEVVLVPVLQNLGRRHAYIAGFQPQYLPGFMKAILAVFAQDLGPEVYTMEARVAWEKLANFICVMMTEGYNEVLEKQRKIEEGTIHDSENRLKVDSP